jgi:GPH family glycoside/pentoside/hexuronide:cation symporter
MRLDGRVPFRTRCAWLLGAAPDSIKNVSWDFFVLFYYSQVLGLSGSLIGLALGVILLSDALVDPWVGALSDGLRRAPLGRRHTVMAAGVLPFALGFVGVFSPPAGLSQWALFGWLLGFGLLARVGISFYTVPAFAVGAELSRDPRERSTLVALRNMGANFGMLSVTLLAFRLFFVDTPAYPRGQLDPAPYPAFGLTFGLVAATCMLLGIVGTFRPVRALERLEIRNVDQDAPRPRIVHDLQDSLRRALSHTPNVRRLLVLSFVVSIVQSVITSLTLHLATYLWQLDGAQSGRLIAGGILGSLAGYFTAPWVVPRFERKQVMRAMLFGFFGCSFLSIALPLSGLAPPAGSTALGMLVLGLRTLAGLCYGWYLVATGTMSLDICDEHEVNTGRPQQATVMSLVFLGMQAASAVSGLLGGVFLDLVDFPRGLPVAQMPADKVQALGVFVCVIVLAGSTLLGTVIGAFEVSRDKQAEVNRRLERLKRGAADTTPGAGQA